MSDNDSNDTIIPDDVLSPPSVVRTLSQIMNVKVDEDMVIPRKSKRDDTQTTTSVRNPATTLSMGLMKTRTCTTSVEMVQMMVLLISEQFKMTAEVTTELLVQLSVYFAHTGIRSRDFPAFITKYVDWPLPHTIATPT